MARLIEKRMPYEFRHIRRFKEDLVTINPLSIAIDKFKGTDKNKGLQCAASETPFNGLTRFSVGFKCGCIVSDQTRKELASKEDERGVCVAC